MIGSSCQFVGVFFFFCLHKGCDNGYYGYDCKDNCGNCRGINQCVYTNGTCVTGCDDGYQGYLCKTRESIWNIRESKENV